MTNPSSPTPSTSNSQARAASSNTPSTVNERKNQNAQPRVRRRNRIISSCLECRRRKLKCDKGQPCSNCVKVSRQCLFISPSFDAAAQARLAEVKEKMGILERSLEDDISQRSRAQKGLSPASDYVDLASRPETAYSGEEEEEDTKHLKSSHYATEDNAYYEDEYADDDIVDLGIALGKLRITERIGGLVRPKFSDEVSLRTPTIMAS